MHTSNDSTCIPDCITFTAGPLPVLHSFFYVYT